MTEQTLRSWHVEWPDVTVTYDDSDPEIGPVPSGYQVNPPVGAPPVVAAEYIRVLDAYDEARCAMGPDECAVWKGALIGLHLEGYVDTYGNELEREGFTEFAIVLLPLTSGIKAVSVCVDCAPEELYASRTRTP